MKFCSTTLSALLAVVVGVSAAPQPAPLVANSLSNGTLHSRALSADAQVYLDQHNNARKTYHANALKWNTELEAMAKTWTQKCKFQHSGGSLRKDSYGENLAAASGTYKPADAIKSWMNEAKDYNPGNPQPSHFTQVVWKDTKEVGCAWTKCPAGSIFDPKYGEAIFHSCTYSPPGNVIGRFPQNVQI